MYELLKELALDEDAPLYVQANVSKAPACVWRSVNDLDSGYEARY